MKFFPLIIAASVSLSACGTQTPVAFDAYGVEKGAGSRGIHTVLEGDTVYTIAQNYRLPMREIITLNNIEAPYVLNTGYRIKLPPPNEYRVREGDTVASIARMHETSPSQIVQLNDLTPPYHLRYGQSLRLPTSVTRQQAAMRQENIDKPIQNAQVIGVDRQPIEHIDDDVNKAIIPPHKPQHVQAQANQASTQQANMPQAKVQKASTQRAAIPKTTPKLSGSGKFMRPVEGQIISNFGPKTGGLHNDGINIKAVRGTAVRAAENGVVVYTGDDLDGYGNLVLIRHENKLMSAYAHLDKTLIRRGAKVVKGQSIGTVGSTGQVDSPQLHFEIRRGSTALNPLTHL